MSQILGHSTFTFDQGSVITPNTRKSPRKSKPTDKHNVHPATPVANSSDPIPTLVFANRNGKETFRVVVNGQVVRPSGAAHRDYFIVGDYCLAGEEDIQHVAQDLAWPELAKREKKEGVAQILEIASVVMGSEPKQFKYAFYISRINVAKKQVRLHGMIFFGKHTIIKKDPEKHARSYEDLEANFIWSKYMDFPYLKRYIKLVVLFCSIAMPEGAIFRELGLVAKAGKVATEGQTMAKATQLAERVLANVIGESAALASKIPMWIGSVTYYSARFFNLAKKYHDLPLAFVHGYSEKMKELHVLESAKNSGIVVGNSKENASVAKKEIEEELKSKVQDAIGAGAVSFADKLIDRIFEMPEGKELQETYEFWNRIDPNVAAQFRLHLRANLRTWVMQHFLLSSAIKVFIDEAYEAWKEPNHDQVVTKLENNHKLREHVRKLSVEVLEKAKETFEDEMKKTLKE